MSIHLITGRPGQGKTLFAVKHLVDEVLPAAEKEGRLVFHNINGLTVEHPNLHEMPREAVHEWPSAPDNSIFFIDECQEHFPVRSGSKVPHYISRFEKHRHQGLDFYLITQGGSLIDSHLHPLIETHRECVRPSGLNYSLYYQYNSYNPRPRPQLRTSDAIVNRWRFDKKYFALYRSATLHTVRPKVPWSKIAMLVGLLALVGLLTFYAVTAFKNVSEPVAQVADGQGIEVPFVTQACAQVVARIGDTVVYLYQSDRLSENSLDFYARITEGVIQLCT